jgi:hypothetical protein
MTNDGGLSDVSNRVTADDRMNGLDDDADLEAQREVFLAMVEDVDGDEALDRQAEEDRDRR